jgi:hypothetical protein
MKRLLFILAAAAMVFSLSSSSCQKQDDPKPKEDVVMKPAATADEAQVILMETLTEKPRCTVEGKDYTIQSIEITEGKRYLLALEEGTTKASSLKILSGKFTISNDVLNLLGVLTAKIQLNSNKLALSLIIGSKTYDLSKAKITKPQNSSVEGVNAARTWVVENTLLKINGNGVNVESTFKGCDLHEIADFASKNGVKDLDASLLAGYAVSECIFTGNSTLTISFSGALAPAVYGKYDLKKDVFSYKLSLGGNDILNANANGTLNFPADQKAELMLNETIKGYATKLTLYMSAVD